MKRVLYLLSAILFLTVACNGSKDNPDTPPVQENLSVSPASLSFSADGTQVETVTVTASGKWTVSPSNSWITLSAASGTGNGSVKVTAAYNASAKRTGKLTFKLGSLSKVVDVSQEGDSSGEEVEVVPAPAAFDGTKRASTAYQILVYSFNDGKGNDGVGDFKGIQDKLDYLDDLGVTALWLSPAHPTASYHGYDVDDYFGLNPWFGTEQDFKNLIDAAHAKGIKIYMDYVLNHSGKHHPWFKEALANPSSKYRDYYFISSNPQSDFNNKKFPMLDGTKFVSGDWKKVSAGAPVITITKADASAEQTGNSDWNLWFWKDGSNGTTKRFVANSDGTYSMVLKFDGKMGILLRKGSKDDDWTYKFGAGSGQPVEGSPYTLAPDGDNAYFTATGYYKIELSNASVETLYYLAGFGDWMPDLNYGDVNNAQNNVCFQDLAASADQWIKMGVDGFRLDAVKHLCGGGDSDGSLNHANNQILLKKWYDHCNATYKAQPGNTGDIFMVGEGPWGHDGDSQYYQGLPSVFEFSYGWTLKDALNNGSGYRFANTVINYISSHTDKRSDAVTSFFLTNHDQDRWAEELGGSLPKQKQAAAILLTGGGKPFIYMGEELGYGGRRTGDTDTPRRMPMAWDASFTGLCKYGLDDEHKKDNTDYNIVKGSVSVATQEADANSLLNVYKTWSRLRNTYPALATGTMSKHGTLNETNTGAQSIAAWYMTAGSQKLLVVHNLGAQEKKVTIQDNMTKPIALLGTASVTGKTLKLGPNSSVVFEL